ncbi:hypothetical protein Celal_3187 [Cellulophaga algicola DSM 14237]|uniref:YD repeat-containing protein n=1 Tax=Cellulophaga algicola (strain DSM 14237 / IC166 / ACAM 630) TaxID=688270 RepID=E6X4W9_CELAD|nr:hypothetical protein Celal_3187 [Cellulophaga algicola DSM 14237]
MLFNIKTKKNRLTNLFIGIILIFSLSNCSEKKANNDWTTENLNNKVQSYTELSYEVLEKKKQEKEFKKNEKNFDKLGKITEEFVYEFDESGTKFIPKYNEKDEKTELFCYAIYSNSLLYKWVYEYDEKQNKIKDEIYNSSNELTLERFFTYNEKGNKTETTERYLHNPKGVVNRKTYEYDENENVIRINTYDPTGKDLKSYYTFVYDNYGNKIEENIFKPNGDPSSKWVYKYVFDEKNNWIKKTELDQGLFPKYILERAYVYYE